MIEHATSAPEHAAGQPPSEPPRRVGPVAIIFLLAMAVGLGVMIYRGIGTRVSAQAKLEQDTHNAAAIDVAVTHPKRLAGAQEVILPGDVEAFIDAPIYARVNGYLKKWYFDIGARVHKGDVLADIEAPELDAQLLQAQANLATANANLALAKTQATRWQDLIKTNAVSQDELDQKVGAFNADKAIVAADEANVRNLQEQVSFEKVIAPFDGVITARRTDVGALIAAGSGATATELFHLAAIDRVRVFIDLPEQDRASALSGASASLYLNEFPDKKFTGVIARNANSIDPSARTLRVEIDVDNPNGQLLPGSYVSVHLKSAGAANPIVIPSNTLLFRAEGLRAAVVRNGKAELLPVKVGRDFGESLEILDGLKPEDSLIVNPPDSILPGAPVRVIPDSGK
ncbi:MAG TPA: efflux RND transporter periplasmic adaptor subunit [Bryobacteraceae bacterium]|nr:efflux RND transporter periplasmic adaptor subunit [Bryobacteraceae bacterium]